LSLSSGGLGPHKNVRWFFTSCAQFSTSYAQARLIAVTVGVSTAWTFIQAGYKETNPQNPTNVGGAASIYPRREWCEEKSLISPIE
jgi:hypothetical protein